MVGSYNDIKCTLIDNKLIMNKKQIIIIKTKTGNNKIACKIE